MRARLLLCAALAAGALAGCIDAFDPDVGPALRARCDDDDGDPDNDVSFQTDLVEGIFKKRCNKCHTPGGDTPLGLELGGLDLSSYQSLRAGGVNGPNTVVAGSPCESILLQKIGDAPPFGGRMPLSGPPFLTEEEIQLVHDWIAEGALDR